MKSAEQVLMAKPDKVSRAAHVRDQAAEDCRLAFSDTVSSPTLKDATDNNEEYEVDRNSCWESEDGESDASSNALNGHSQLSDAGSLDPHFEKTNVRGCPSGSSIVTYDEASSKMHEVGECERTRDRKVTQQKVTDWSGAAAVPETSINVRRGISESVGPAWTEDKHCSYLNSIEATFVQSLYGQDYCGVDVSGQDDQDCVESRPMYFNYSSHLSHCELFTSLQRGCYDQREYYRPQFLHNFAPIVCSSPWIQHFNPRITPFHGSSVTPDLGYCSPPTAIAGGGYKEMVESCPALRDATQDILGLSRLNSHHFTSTSAPGRSEILTQVKKRSCNLDPSTDDIFLPKKQKTTQRLLAEMDLKMEQQFVLAQKTSTGQLDYLNLNDQPPGLAEGIGYDFDLKEDNEDLTSAEEMPHVMPQAIPGSFGEPWSRSSTQSGDRFWEDADKVTILHGSNPCEGQLLQPHVEPFVIERSGRKKGTEAAGGHCAAHVGVLGRPWKNELSMSRQPDVAFYEDEECKVVLRKGPRASTTYTWGSLGTRRRLHKEHKERNCLVEGTGLSRSIRGARENELQIKH